MYHKGPFLNKKISISKTNDWKVVTISFNFIWCRICNNIWYLQANASEKLRQNGLSHLYPHPVCITQTRSCPLEPPPPPEKIPAWKLIRPKKKKTTPSDEPVGMYKVTNKIEFILYGYCKKRLRLIRGQLLGKLFIGYWLDP